jgi:hypothetical protein
VNPSRIERTSVAFPSGEARSARRTSATGSRRHRLRGVLPVALVAVLALAGLPADAATTVVVTKTGVRTHGSISTTSSTIGWLLTCPLSHRLADDPITAPGVAGGAHLHDFTGNASTNANSTVASMEDPANFRVADQYNGANLTPGTSCSMSTFAPGTVGDTAAYWRPTLYANGKPVTPTVKDQLYYRAKPTFGTGFQPIPQDARLIVGTHSATSVATNPALVDEHLYWECNGQTSTHYQLPPSNCGSILENVVFPSCWDGKAMDHTGPHGTDNGRFAYAVNGACPTGFGVKIPQLSEKFKYDNIPSGALLQFSADPGEDTLAPTYTAHADFWNTWNPVSLQYLVTNCINAKISCGTNPITPLS